jgi:hypothetical protein
MGDISNLASGRLLLGRATPPRFEPATNCQPPASGGRARSQGLLLALRGSSASLRSAAGGAGSTLVIERFLISHDG